MKSLGGVLCMQRHKMPSAAVWIAAFLGGLVCEFLWAWYVQAVEARRAVLAANVAVLIYGCAILLTVLVIEREVLACCLYAAGGWLGTWTAVQRAASSYGPSRRSNGT